MIFLTWKYCLGSVSFILVFMFASAFYTYHVNAKRDSGDPEKRDYSPHSRWLAPIVVPMLFVINIPFFILGSLVFGIFLVVFPFTLLLFRKPFFIKWIQQLALKVGTALLEIDTELLVMAGLYRPPARQTSAS
ncbi:MAG: hypothetical protein ACOYYJ_12385 [Chloroflexota bacterium]